MSSNKGFHRRIYLGAALGISLVAVTAGCATYQAPAASEQEVATLEIDPNSSNLLFTYIDGQPVSSTLGLVQFNRRAPVKLKAGPHTIGIELSKVSATGNSRGFIALEFDAEASKRYRVFERNDGRQFVAWIADESGKSVSRVKPKQ